MILHAKTHQQQGYFATLKDTPLAALSEKSLGKMLRLVCIPFHLICGIDNDWNVFCHRHAYRLSDSTIYFFLEYYSFFKRILD